MSYQVLARKWRPKRFAELIGQEHVKSTLINALSMGRLHHAYLFTGTRGVGKTTIARIFAKSLNCEQGISAEPCGQCDTCLAIEKGHYVDLIEIDAASRTKVEDTREILDNVQYAPTRGRYKVYLIDEVHMLSRHSFNALLKTLEEPPGHIKFLLATTDPQKLPITILSRCLQFNLKALLRSEIKGHLEHILTAEKITFDDEALSLLAKAADGSIRDALSLTDQAIAQSGGDLVLELVEKMLGTIDKQWSVKLLAHIVNSDAPALMATVEEIALFMPDYRHLVDQLLSIFHLGAMTQLVPNAAQVDENLQSFITRLAQKLSPEDIQLYYQILLSGKKDLELAPEPRMGFEMLLLRLLAFRPVKVVSRPSSGMMSETVVSEAMPVPEVVAPNRKSTIETRVHSAPGVSAEQAPEIPQPQESAESTPEQLDEQTLNIQQQSILDLAQHQGYKPVDKPLVDETEYEQSPYVDEPPYLAMDLVAQQQSFSAQSVLDEPEPEPEPQQQMPPQERFEDPVAAILANRNLLQKNMFADKTVEPQGVGPVGEDSVKKSEPVSEVAEQSWQQPQAEPEILAQQAQWEQVEPEPEPEPEPEYAEPSTQSQSQAQEQEDELPRWAHQVDYWANLIEQMGLGGLVRLLAVQSVYQKNDKEVLLTVYQSEKHLESKGLREQLQRGLSLALNEPVELELQFTDEQLDTPLNIQRQIDAARLARAKELIYQDPLIVALQQQFGAEVYDDSIKPVG